MIKLTTKYCQLKSGPQTINNPDEVTISDHFESAKRLARTNNMNLGINDFIIGVIYGTPEKLNGNYKQLSKKYPIYVGKEFWHRLTGDENFYEILIDNIGEVAKEFNSKNLLEDTIKKLSKDIQTNFINKELK